VGRDGSDGTGRDGPLTTFAHFCPPWSIPPGRDHKVCCDRYIRVILYVRVILKEIASFESLKQICAHVSYIRTSSTYST